MSVIYNAKILLKTGSGYPGTVLDLGEAGYDVSNNKFWLGNGIGNPPTGITMDVSFNDLASIVSGLEASSGYYATQLYVDGSLNNIRSIYIPDVSFGLESFYFDASGYIQTAGGSNLGAGIVGKWRFSSTTTDSDPGLGFFRLNNTDPSLATYIYIDYETLGSKNLSDILLDFKQGDNIYFQKLPLISEYGIFKLTGDAIDGTGYVKLPVVSTGVYSGSFTNNNDFGAIFLYTGRDQYATLTYVDGSLNAKVNQVLFDSSILSLTNWQVSQDASILLRTTFSYVDGSLNLKVNRTLFDSSILNLTNKDLSQDASILLRPTFSYVDGSLNLKVNKTLFDSSISSLTSWQISQDASILLRPLTTYVDGSLNLKVDKTLFDSSILSLTNWQVSQDASIIRIDASLGDYVKKSGDIMTGNLVIQTDISVNGKGSFGKLNVSGSSLPGDPSDGDQFFIRDGGILYVYDASRGKHLSVGRSTIAGGRTTAVAGSTVYVRVGDATQSSTAGYRMIRNGTITGFSVNNNNILTATRDVQIRINDVSALTRTIVIGQSGFNFDQANVDFSAGDLLQVSTLPGGTGSALNNWIILIEFATRS